MLKITKGWLSIWLYVMIAIAGVLVGLTAANWSVFTMQTKLVALETALLALHVLEEWRFPGGFHYMYNLMAGSDIPDRYPMNQRSDMWTNWLGILFGCFCLIVGVTPVLALMQLMLCLGEVLAHTVSGFLIQKRFRTQGKRTIYNPGLFTTLLGYLPIGAALIVSFVVERAPTLQDVVLAILCGGILIAVVLLVPEKLCKDRDTPYGFTWGAGYFARFLR